MIKYLLDTNLLIHLFDEESSKDHKENAKKILAQKLQEESEFFVTELIRYEVLRGVAWDNCDKLQKLKKYLAVFPVLEIKKEVGDIARNLWRYEKAKYPNSSKNFDKYRFDAFHVATAKFYGLQLLSMDTDIKTIDELYQDMEKDYKLLPS